MVTTRGKPEEVISDNGTNFVGAERQLRELIQSLDQTRIVDDAANKGIKRSWNPPLGLHFGGVFEQLIRDLQHRESTSVDEKDWDEDGVVRAKI